MVCTIYLTQSVQQNYFSSFGIIITLCRQSLILYTYLETIDIECHIKHQALLVEFNYTTKYFFKGKFAFSRHCVLRGGTQHRVLPSCQSVNNENIRVPEWKSNPSRLQAGTLCHESAHKILQNISNKTTSKLC